MAPKKLVDRMRYKMTSVPRNKEAAPRPYSTDLGSATRRIVPPQGHFPGYQRSGMLLFNNINSYDANATNNNQTLGSQTFDQILQDSSIKVLPKFSVDRD